jgi:hypothetical protein
VRARLRCMRRLPLHRARRTSVIMPGAGTVAVMVMIVIVAAMHRSSP